MHSGGVLHVQIKVTSTVAYIEVGLISGCPVVCVRLCISSLFVDLCDVCMTTCCLFVCLEYFR